MASSALLAADYASLAKEAGRRHSDVRDAADKAHQLVKQSKEQAFDELRTDHPPSQHPLYQPIFLASPTRNAKIIALAMSALQRLIVAGAVPKTSVEQILDTLEQVIPQGVEIQLKILQILNSLLTTNLRAADAVTSKLVQGEELGRALELSHRLSTSKIPVVASTASATLRQLFMFVFERVGEEDALVASSSDPNDPSLPPATFDVDVPPLEEDRAASLATSIARKKPYLPGDGPQSPEVPQKTPPFGATLQPDSQANETRSMKLRPAARDAYLLLEDLCLLIAGAGGEGAPDGEPSFLRWGSLSRTFGLELVESIVSGFGGIVRTHPELLLVLRAHLCPLLIRFLSSPPHSTLSSSTSFNFSFALTLRLTRVVFLLLKQFSDLLTLESEVFLTMFVRVIGPGDRGEGEGGHPAGPAAGQNSPLWMRVLALEIFRGLCSDFGFMMKVYQRYDAATREVEERRGAANKGKGRALPAGGSTVFSDMMTAFNRLATEKPSVLGVGAAVMYGSSLGPVFTSVAGSSAVHASTGMSPAASSTGVTGSAVIDSAMEMGYGLAQAAGSVVGSSVAAAAGAVSAAGGAAAGPSLDVQTASMKLQCIDQLDKAEPPQIPETYIFLLALQCLSALADGFAAFTLATYGDVIARRQKTRGSAPPALNLDQLAERDPQVASLLVVRSMAESAWPALLASMSFFIATALSNDLFSDVVTSLQNFTSVLGVLDLETPREAFLTSLCKFAMPPAVVSHIMSQQDHFSSHASKPSSAAAAAATAVLSAGAESLGLLAGGSLSASLPIGLSSRNLACLRALMSVAHYLAGSLGYSWFCVFETLQNADFVIRATSGAKSAKKRTQAPSPAAHGTPAKAGAGGGTTGQPAAPDQSTLPVVPTEADELAVQQAIAKLFEVSINLDDGAFRQFLGALCRLSGEMIGLQMNKDGTVVQYAGDDDRSENGSTGAATPLDTPDRSRRRSSGLSTSRGASTKGGDKSFGIAKLGAVALLNVSRLVQRPPDVGWELLTSHLLFVLHSTSTSTPIRLQAADVLGSILTAAIKALSASGLASDVDLQERAQSQVLAALAAQAEPAPRLQLASDVEIRRLALDTLLNVLEANGHSFVTGWTQIFRILRTACPTASFFAPPSPVVPSAPRRSLDTITEHDGIGPMTPMRSSVGANGYFNLGVDGAAKSAKSAVLIRTSFPSLQLICTDFLDALDVEGLRDCITTLGEFGKQIEDVNVALTAGGLIWGVSDHVQAKRKQGDGEAAHAELWMFLLHNLLGLCRDSRQEVRDAAITNVFRSISMYGSTLDDSTWDACCWEVIFPLVDDITSTLRRRSNPAADDIEHFSEETVPQPNAPPIRLTDKQWDESLTLALRYLGDVFFDYLSQLVKLDRYDEIWAAFVDRTRDSFIRDRPVPATAAMQALEKVLTVSLDMSAAERIRKSWEVAWRTWDDVGTAIEENARAGPDEVKVYTQVNLEAFVRVALPIYTPPHITFDLTRVQRLLAILKSALTYRRSPDYRADVDGLMPLQSAVLEVVTVIKLDDVPGAASAVLSDLSEYLKLAFVAPFETSPASRMGGGQHVTYVALAKEVMPHVQWLYRKYRDEPFVYEQGAVEHMLQAYTLPIRLKHDCPAPAKFGSAEPLWKTATVNYLKAVRDVVSGLETLDLPSQTEEAVWKQLVAGIAEALLASSRVSATQRTVDLHREEEFDLALLASLEHDVLPHLGSPRVPDDLICQLAKALQLASRLYRLDLPNPSAGSTVEPRFSLDFDEQVKGEMFGTTVEIVENRKERFAYWCLDMLFLICDGDKASDPERRRLAALSVPSLVNRCAAIIKIYIADAPLRGKMPFPRIRQEELIYVLQRLSTLRLAPNTLWAATQPSPSSAMASSTSLSSTSPRELVRAAKLRSPLAHLYELQGLLTELLGVARNEPSIAQAYMPQRFAVGLRDGDEEVEWEGLPAGCKVGIVGRRRRVGAGQGENEMDVAKLALKCMKLVGEEIGASLSFV